MQHIVVSFHSPDRPIDGRQVTARGLHGLLFHVLQQFDREAANELHTHPAPKPFSMVPYYTENGHLAGLRYAAVTEAAAALLAESWLNIYHKQQLLKLGRYQTFYVRHVECLPGYDFISLANLEPISEMLLNFLSPTAFKQGKGSLPLPLPGNVFRGPWYVWNTFAQDILSIPESWLQWCEQDVFITEHQIETAVIALNRDNQFTGFVGRVKYEAYRGSEEQLRIWQALGTLAAFCGVGHKTTMGMGAVEKAL